MHGSRVMRHWLVGVVIACSLLLVAILVLLEREHAQRGHDRNGDATAPSMPASARRGAEQRRRGPGLDVVAPGPSRVPGPRRDGNGVQAMPELRPGDVAAGLHKLEQRRRATVVEREYQRWFDAGYEPHQVEVELLDDGRMIQRITSSDAGFDDEPIAPGVLTVWDMMHLDRDVVFAISSVLDYAREQTAPCANAINSAEPWTFTYVWHVRAASGVVRAQAEIRDEWWPRGFIAADRACYRAAYDAIALEELPTDARDFEYRVEFHDNQRMEGTL